jgi:hypothetical protein
MSPNRVDLLLGGKQQPISDEISRVRMIEWNLLYGSSRGVLKSGTGMARIG